MALTEWFGSLLGIAYSLLVLGCLLTALFRKKEPSQALGWSLAIVFLPVLGPLAFLLFGWNRVSRKLNIKLGHHEGMQEHLEALVQELQDNVGDLHLAPERADRWGGLRRMLASLREHAAGECRKGNRVQLYRNGQQAFEEMGEAIRQAKDFVHIEFFIFRGDEVGTRAIDLLIEKVREGVEVRLIVDALGSFTGLRNIQRLRDAGGKVASFLPLFFGAKLASPNLRNHRKTVICDGKVAFFGGLNVANEYLGHWWQKNRDWFDLHMRMEGPSVWDLQWMFVEDWDYCAEEFLGKPRYFPPQEEVGETTAQVIWGGPDTRPNAIRQAFFAAFSRARRRIVIASPYLVPDLALREAMKSAARSGIEVHIVTQGSPPDKWWPWFCGWYYCEELIEAGVHVHSYLPGMMHAKAIAVDGEWAMLGTANLDNRSMFLNFEQMTIFDRADEAQQIEEVIESLFEQSAERSLEDLANKAWYKKVLIRTSRLLSPLL